MAPRNDHYEGLKELIHTKGNDPGIVQGLHIHYPHLVHLNLSENGITSLPPDFFHLTSLRHLNLSYNQLSVLPREFEKLKELNYLDLCGNNLTGNSLSEGLFELVNLRHLHLSDNQLESVPLKMSRMKNLRVLGLRNTGLKSLDSRVFHSLNRLNVIHLQGNQLAHL